MTPPDHKGPEAVAGLSQRIREQKEQPTFIGYPKQGKVAVPKGEKRA